jgi:predicted MFS family arabinose efflux permease
MDVGGAVTVTAGLLVLVYAIVNAQTAGWLSGQTLALGGAGIALLVGFVAIELRHRNPLIRLNILRTRSLAVADLSMLVVAAGMFGMFYFASLYVQGVLGFSPLTAGLAFLPVTAGIIVGAGLSQRLIPALGVRATAMGGMGLAAIGLLLLSRIPVHGTYLGDLLPGLMTMAVGMGLTFVPITLIATTNVEPNDAGLASGLLNSAQQVGGALGLAVLATLAANATANAPASGGVPAALVSGYQVAFFVAALLIGSGVVFFGLLLRRQHVSRIDVAEEVAIAA